MWESLLNQLLRHTKSTETTYPSPVTAWGGSGVWKFALRAPELYARFAPLSGSVVFSEENVERLKDLKIRAFVGALDTVVPPSSSIMMVEALEEAGGDAALTVYDDADHFAVPGRAFLENTVLIEWLTGEAAL